MGADLNNIVRTQKLTDEHVQFLVYQILRGLKVGDLAKQLGGRPIVHVDEYPTMHYFGNSRRIQSMKAYDFDLVLLEIPVKNRIKCPIIVM